MNNKIIIHLNEEKDYINKFNPNRISEELYNYIINEAKTISLTDKIIIEIIQNEYLLTDLQKEELCKVIKMTYEDDMNDLIYFDNKLVLKDLILLLIGIIITFICFLFKNLPPISEIILIKGWLMIWEALDKLLFSRTENKIKITRRKQLIKSKIIFNEQNLNNKLNKDTK